MVEQKEQEGQQWFRVLAKASPDRSNSQETNVQSLTLERTLEIQTITWTPVTELKKLRERDTANAGPIKSFIFPNSGPVTSLSLKLYNSFWGMNILRFPFILAF